MHKPLVLILAALSGGISAEKAKADCDLPESLCKLQAQFEVADKALNNTYRQIITGIDAGGLSASLVDKTVLKNSLIKSQRSWIKFKSANCDAFYTLHSGGRQRNEAQLECEIEMTKSRTQYLNKTYLL
ncbi:lysozyme inhibitor LprI family protein [Microbulbifer sp. SSSA002]|uniref:lysozyme inhibitor LprI family protein n=1 Tax=unclassified Microbulbifer TaxID=2619833 RepID=UPI00403A0E71